MKKPTARRLRIAALVLTSFGLQQAVASAQFDASISAIEINQGLQNGNQPLVGERATFVRVSTTLVNPPNSPQPIDGLMRVFVGGVEVPESPIFSENGPYPAQLNSNLNQLNGTLNFFYLPPTSNNVVITVELNPAGPNFVPEANTANNTESTAVLDFQERAIPEYAYARIDYRPGGGGGFNPPPEGLIEPGVGDSFVQGIFASSDINYHRADAAYKLWTGNLSGSGTALLNSMAAEALLMVPKPQFYYGWVPGGLPYNGVSFLNSRVSMGNTQSFKNQRTYAHEIGHNVGRQHVNNQTGWVGIDVEHHLNQPTVNNLTPLKPTNAFDIMVAGLNTNQAWIRPNMYSYVFNHPKYQPGPIVSQLPSIMINGIWNTETGAVTLSHVFAPPQGDPSVPASPEETAFLVRAFAGDDLIQLLPIARGTQAESCADGTPLTEIGIQAVLPEGSQFIDRVEIQPAAGVAAQSVTLQRSPNAPEVSFVTPGQNGDVSAGLIHVSWTGSDADGDDLTYYLRYSRDGFHFSPLATGLAETEFEVDLRELPALVDGQGFFQLLASDGLNTTVLNSAVLNGGGNLFANGGGNDPWVYIVTPDPLKVYQKGATVFLHSSGWDLEDRGLPGSAIAWTSDVDGAIGTGRITSTASLSVGVHMITATATDSDGQTATDTHQVEITDRQLPTVLSGGPIVYCTSKTNSQGCLPSIGWTGSPSATAGSGFDVLSVQNRDNVNGNLTYSINGPKGVPFQGGWNCVQGPKKRTGLQNSGGAGLCTGEFHYDFNARIASGADPTLVAGQTVWCQYWSRDAPATFGSNRSDALEFTILP